jgi:hypothetical protein
MLFRIFKANVVQSDVRVLATDENSPTGGGNDDDFVETSEVDPWLQLHDWQFSLLGCAYRLWSSRTCLMKQDNFQIS